MWGIMKGQILEGNVNKVLLLEQAEVLELFTRFHPCNFIFAMFLGQLDPVEVGLYLIATKDISVIGRHPYLYQDYTQCSFVQVDTIPSYSAECSYK